MRVMYDSTLPTSALTTLNVTIGFSFLFDFFGKDPAFLRAGLEL